MEYCICRKHPNRDPSPGVCSLCLKECLSSVISRLQALCFYLGCLPLFLLLLFLRRFVGVFDPSFLSGGKRRGEHLISDKQGGTASEEPSGEDSLADGRTRKLRIAAVLDCGRCCHGGGRLRRWWAVRKRSGNGGFIIQSEWGRKVSSLEEEDDESPRLSL